MRKHGYVKAPLRINFASSSTTNKGLLNPLFVRTESPVPLSVKVMVLPAGMVTVSSTKKLLSGVIVAVPFSSTSLIAF